LIIFDLRRPSPVPSLGDWHTSYKTPIPASTTPHHSLHTAKATYAWNPTDYVRSQRPRPGLKDTSNG
ncbi:hypothetical protein MMC31_006334, partial [Peltigera leucophlebia]|nr:hypothetical protein [Peltigera leucophlebia]